MSNKVRYWIVSFLMVVMLLPAFSNVHAEAAPTYTITFRAGNVGSFDVDKVNASTKNGSLVEVRPEYIRVTARRGQTVQSALYDGLGKAVVNTGDMNAMFLGFLKSNSEYTLLDEASWGPAVSDTVRHNEEYVLDYGVLVAPVAYTVRYVDAQSNEDVAAPIMSYGSEGDTITLAPITVSEYATEDEPVTLVLFSDEANTVTFFYTYTGVTYVPGETNYETVYNDITNVVTIPTVVNDGGAGNGEVDNGGADNGLADDNGADNGEQNIDDPQVPLADGEQAQDEGSQNVTNIEEEDTPLSDGAADSLPNAWIVGGIVATVLLAAAVILVLVRLRKAASIEKKEK